MLDLLPDAPDPATDSPQVFNQKAAAFVLAQKALAAQFNDALSQFNASLAGGAYALGYVFDSATADADPGTGKLRLSNATQNAAAVLRVDVQSAGQDVTSILDAFDASTSAVKGSIRLVKMGDPSKWLTFDVTARAAPSGYRNLTVSNTGGSSANPFAAGDGVLLYFQRNGDKGNTGDLLTPMLYVREEFTTTPGLVAATVVRPFNTVRVNSISGASLSSGQITLPAGTYDFEASAPSVQGPAHRLELQNVTDGNTRVEIGRSNYNSTYGYASGQITVNDQAMVRGRFTITSTKVFRFTHYQPGANASNSYGQPSQISGAGNEVYAEAIFRKIA